LAAGAVTHPVAQCRARIEDVSLGDRAGCGTVPPVDGVEQCRVLGPASATSTCCVLPARVSFPSIVSRSTVGWSPGFAS